MKFELAGFGTVTRNTVVPLGLTVEQNVSMRAAGVAETVQVVAEAPAPIATPVVGLNMKHEEIEALATPRTIQGIAQLSPAVSENVPNQGTSGGTVGQVIINGAFAFDNVFMINGVDINDNLFAQPQNLFIEDAIEETQVLTSGISAEFGRFSGGVVNAITSSGGNMFSGSGRINFSNPAWTTETPFEMSRGTEHVDEVSRVYEGTFGGPLLRDRLWFFSSGRYGKGANQVTLAQTGIGLTSIDTNKRGEIKLTGTVAQNHTIQGGYLNSPRTRTNNSGLQTLRHRSPQRSRSRQSELVLLHQLPRACRRTSCWSRRSTRNGATGSPATAARAPTSSSRRFCRCSSASACTTRRTSTPPTLNTATTAS